MFNVAGTTVTSWFPTRDNVSTLLKIPWQSCPDRPLRQGRGRGGPRPRRLHYRRAAVQTDQNHLTQYRHDHNKNFNIGKHNINKNQCPFKRTMYTCHSLSK